MDHYNISFDFTDPKNPKDVNHMNHLKGLTKEEKDAWITELIPIAISTKSWIISHLTISKHS